MAVKKTDANKDKSFEKSLMDLEKLVEKLETGKSGLEESLELFEKGVILYKDCKSKLDKVEKKIAKLSQDLKEEQI